MLKELLMRIVVGIRVAKLQKQHRVAVVTHLNTYLRPTDVAESLPSNFHELNAAYRAFSGSDHEVARGWKARALLEPLNN